MIHQKTHHVCSGPHGLFFFKPIRPADGKSHDWILIAHLAESRLIDSDVKAVDKIGDAYTTQLCQVVK